MSEEIPVDVYNPSLTLKAGDSVRFQRSGFSHWGIYVGNGKVVHLTDVDKSSSQTASTSLMTGPTAIFKREYLREVAGTSKVYKNNTYDRIKRPLDKDTILKRAEAVVGRMVSHDLLTKNCEHYTTWMRNDGFKSSQVKTVETAGWGITVALTGVSAVFIALAMRELFMNIEVKYHWWLPQWISP